MGDRPTLGSVGERGKAVVKRGVFVTSLLALLAAALSPASPADAASAATQWDSRDARVSSTQRLFKGEQKGLYEPTIAIDPANPRNMIAFAIDLSVQNKKPEMWSVTREYRSTNGGRTWIDHGPVRYTRKGDDITQSGDPVVLFDGDRNVYYASLASPPGRAGGIYVHRSRNGGATWNVPVVAVAEIEDKEKDECTGTDKEWLSSDPRTGHLYLTYTLFTFTCSRTGAAYTRLLDIGVYLTTSDDRGTTWRKPREIWDGYALGAMPKVGPDGSLFATFWATVELPPTACPTALGVVAAKGGGRPFVSIVAASSNDGGKSWRFEQRPICDFIAGEILKPGRFVGGSFLPTLSVDQATGTAFVAYPSFVPSQGRFTIEIISSTDRGASWSSPIEVTPGPNDARMPALFADEGVVRLVYVETSGLRDHNSGSSDGTAQTMYVESTDDGASWSQPLALSTKIGRPKEYTELGDYIGLDVAGGRIAAIWTDARKASEYGEIWARAGSVASAETDGAAYGQVPRGATSLLERSSLPFGAGTLPLFSPPHRSFEGASVASGTGERCRSRSLTRLSRAVDRGRAASVRVSCSIPALFAYVSQKAEALGYATVFSDNEGHEAELLVARHDYVVLVRMLATGGASEIFVERL